MSWAENIMRQHCSMLEFVSAGCIVVLNVYILQNEVALTELGGVVDSAVSALKHSKLSYQVWIRSRLGLEMHALLGPKKTKMSAKSVSGWQSRHCQSLLLCPGRGVEYCDQPICLSVCLSVCLDICLDVNLDATGNKSYPLHTEEKRSFQSLPFRKRLKTELFRRSYTTASLPWLSIL